MNNKCVNIHIHFSMYIIVLFSFDYQIKCVQQNKTTSTILHNTFTLKTCFIRIKTILDRTIIVIKQNLNKKIINQLLKKYIGN